MTRVTLAPSQPGKPVSTRAFSSGGKSVWKLQAVI